MPPRHDRYGRDRVLRRALDNLVADREVDERVPLLVDEPVDMRVLEEHRGARRIHRLPVAQAVDVDRDRPDLAAGNREARRVRGEPEAALDAAGARLADMARDPRHPRVVERADAHPVVRPDKAKRRADAGQVIRPCRYGKAKSGRQCSSGRQPSRDAKQFQHICHCKRSEAIACRLCSVQRDCFVAPLLAMTIRSAATGPQAPLVSKCIYPARRRRGAGRRAFRYCRRYRPVWLASTWATSSGVPVATMYPPASPPSGPRSMIQSAVLMTSRLCSMTSTVLPAATSACSTSNSLRTSSKCRPVVGSSKMYKVRPVARRDNSFDSLTRCASPPDSVVAGWPTWM